MPDDLARLAVLQREAQGHFNAFLRDKNPAHLIDAALAQQKIIDVLADHAKTSNAATQRSALLQHQMGSLKLMGGILSSVSRTRSEISMTFARNARA